MNMKHQIGIALSGGAARGVAHIGVLQALHENDVYPSIISGCSAGAIIGVLYANDLKPAEIFKLIENKNLLSMVRMRIPDKGMMELGYFEDILKKNIPHDSFDALQKDFYLSVTNLNKGGCEIMHKGKNLIQFVIASASIPLAFKPVKIDEYYYVDGGVINNMPTEAIREKCEILIGVNVNTVQYIKTIHGIKDVGMRCLDISLKEHVQSRLNQCDVVIEPDTSAFGLFDLSKAKAIYDAGYQATIEIIPALKEKISQHYGTTASGK